MLAYSTIYDALAIVHDHSKVQAHLIAMNTDVSIKCVASGGLAIFVGEDHGSVKRCGGKFRVRVGCHVAIKIDTSVTYKILLFSNSKIIKLLQRSN